jgi:predicted nucleotidyltransferase
MDRDEVLRRLRGIRATLREQYGVQSLTLFGSIARGEGRPDSDVDLVVEFARPTGYFGLVALQLYLQTVLGRDVDLGTPGSLRPALWERVRREAIHVS